MRKSLPECYFDITKKRDRYSESTYAGGTRWEKWLKKKFPLKAIVALSLVEDEANDIKSKKLKGHGLLLED